MWYTNYLSIWGAAIPLLFNGGGTVYAAASRHGYGRVFVNAHEGIQSTTTGEKGVQIRCASRMGQHPCCVQRPHCIAPIASQHCTHPQHPSWLNPNQHKRCCANIPAGSIGAFMKNVVLWAADAAASGGAGSRTVCYDSRGYNVKGAATGLAAMVSRASASSCGCRLWRRQLRPCCPWASAGGQQQLSSATSPVRSAGPPAAAGCCLQPSRAAVLQLPRLRHDRL